MGKRIQLLRNSVICDTLEEAQSVIESTVNSEMSDGEPVLARYYTDEYQDEVNVLMGVRTVDGEDESHVSYVALDNGDTLRKVSDRMNSGSFCVDFSDNTDTVQMCNMSDKSMKFETVRLFNVNKLKLTTSSLIKVEVDNDNANTIIVAPGDMMSWDIEREIDNKIASVGISYKLVKNNV